MQINNLNSHSCKAKQFSSGICLLISYLEGTGQVFSLKFLFRLGFEEAEMHMAGIHTQEGRETYEIKPLTLVQS